MNKIVSHFSEVDMSEMTYPLITIFFNPKDMPNKYIARLFDMQSPTNIVVIGDSIDDIRKTIPKDRFILIPRKDNDHESVVEVWM